MRALLFGVALLVLATAGPVTAYQPTEPQEPTEEGQPAHPRGGERPMSTPRPERQAGAKCRSSAGDKSAAEEFCEKQLNCSGQGLTIKCSDTPNNYVCRCV
jgi:hypothetical protein